MKPKYNEKKSIFYDNLRKKEWKSNTDFSPSSQTRYEIILDLLNKYAINQNLKILDCGCGVGNLLIKLKKNGYNNLFGSDFSKESVKLSKKNLNRNIFKGDLTKISDFEKNTFDIIICSEVLEHIEDDLLAINNLYKLLNKNGLLIITVPFNSKYWSQHDKFAGHIRRYNNTELENKLFKNKFKIIKCFGWGSFIYSFYHKILIKKKPSKIMNDNYLIVKKLISKLLIIIFQLEKKFKSKKKARRLFVVARK